MTDDVPHHHTPPQFCPHCGYFHDSASEAHGNAEAPRPGDVSICISCGNPTIYTETMHVRAMTDDEIRALPREQVSLLAKARMHCLARGPIECRGGKA